MMTTLRFLAAACAALSLAACGTEAPAPERNEAEAPAPAPPETNLAAAPSEAPPAADAPAPAPAAKADPAPKAAPRPPIGSKTGYRLIGTEPFWGGTARNGRILYSTPENQAGEPVAATVATGAYGESWRGTLSGKPFVLTLTPGPCSDGMSDNVHALTATLEVRGETRHGCANPLAAAPPAPTPKSGWQTSASGEGAALFLARGGGRAVTLFCPGRSKTLLVNVPAFRAVGSEERMTFGAGGTAVTLVADPRGDRRRGGVSGTGPVPSELAAILRGKIAVNYGSQNAGPFAPPPPALAKTFLAGCRD